MTAQVYVPLRRVHVTLNDAKSSPPWYLGGGGKFSNWLEAGWEQEFGLCCCVHERLFLFPQWNQTQEVGNGAEVRSDSSRYLKHTTRLVGFFFFRLLRLYNWEGEGETEMLQKGESRVCFHFGFIRGREIAIDSYDLAEKRADAKLGKQQRRRRRRSFETPMQLASLIAYKASTLQPSPPLSFLWLTLFTRQMADQNWHLYSWTSIISTLLIDLATSSSSFFFLRAVCVCLCKTFMFTFLPNKWQSLKRHLALCGESDDILSCLELISVGE